MHALSPFPCSICNIIYTYSGLKECMILCQVFPNSCKCTVIQLLWKLTSCHIRWRFSDNSARTCQNIDAKTLLSRFLPLMRNKLTDDVRTRLREKCRIWAKPSYSDLPRNSDAIAWFNKKGPNRELNPGPLPVLRAPLRVSKFSRREYNTTILLGRSVKHTSPIELLIQ